MVPPGWIKPELVLVGAEATDVDELVGLAAALASKASGVEQSRVHAAFLEAARSEGVSLGHGVAIPHTALAEVRETVVCLVTLKAPLGLPARDAHAPDVFWFILSKPDPHGHLLLLAHLARLTRSRTFLAGLREARTAESALELIRAAELRHQGGSTPSAAPRAAEHALVMISVSGEKLVDALLVDLVDQGHGEACVLEAQSLREAAAREVPLFAGFRDLFGDPGGRRVVLVETDAASADGIVQSVRRVCEEHEARDARVSVVPMLVRWQTAPVVEETAGGH